MAARKKKLHPFQLASMQGVAGFKRKPTAKGGKSNPWSKAASSGNVVPLPLLEKRLVKLNRIVAKRGGDAY